MDPDSISHYLCDLTQLVYLLPPFPSLENRVVTVPLSRGCGDKVPGDVASTVLAVGGFVVVLIFDSFRKSLGVVISGLSEQCCSSRVVRVWACFSL